MHVNALDFFAKNEGSKDFTLKKYSQWKDKISLVSSITVNDLIWLKCIYYKKFQVNGLLEHEDGL
jgi:isopentenyl diphosphate isomerase/L-lactate dehydrogenase-like FMN-dependent dehydrogenase